MCTLSIILGVVNVALSNSASLLSQRPLRRLIQQYSGYKKYSRRWSERGGQGNSWMGDLGILPESSQKIIAAAIAAGIQVEAAATAVMYAMSGEAIGQPLIPPAPHGALTQGSCVMSIQVHVPSLGSNAPFFLASPLSLISSFLPRRTSVASLRPDSWHCCSITAEIGADPSRIW